MKKSNDTYPCGAIELADAIANSKLYLGKREDKIIEAFEDIKDIRYGKIGASNSINGETTNKWIKVSSFTVSGAWDPRGFTLEVYPRIRTVGSSRQTLVCLVRNADKDIEAPYVSLNTHNESQPNTRLIKDVRVIRTGGSGISGNNIEVWIQMGHSWANTTYVMYYLYNFNTKDFVATVPQAQTDNPPAGQAWGISEQIEPQNGKSVVKGTKIKVGDKWTMSGVGDAHGNDDWLRLFGTDEKGYSGGFAAGKLWTPELHLAGQVIGDANFVNTVDTPSLRRKNGDWLRINNDSNTGRTALYGNLSINDTIAGHSGLSVGSWEDAGQGSIKATGDVTVKGKICINDTCINDTDLKRYKNIMPQGYINIVNRRPLFGVGVKTVGQAFYGTNPVPLFGAITYGPFGYNVPAVAPGATRKFRMYGVYSDGMTGGRGPVVRVSIFNPSWQEQGLFVDFQFPLTWGGLEEDRDAFSNVLDDPKNGMHGRLYTFIPAGSTGNLAVRWQYIELQTLDIY